MVPRSVISLNSSTRLSACAGSGSGPTVSSSSTDGGDRQAAPGRSGRAGRPAATARRRGGLAAHPPSARARMDGQQLGGVDHGVAAGALVAGQQRLERVARLPAARRPCWRGGQLVAAQLVQQRLHLVRQLGHVLEAEGGRAALDECAQRKMALSSSSSAASTSSSSSICSMLLQVLAGFLEEDLVELAQVECRRPAVRCCRRHHPWLAHLLGSRAPHWRGRGSEPSGSPCR
jgi:hypothetical protein